MFAGALVTVGLLGLAELGNYLYYLRLNKYVNQEKCHDYEVDHEWMKRYLLEELTKDEIIDLITNSITYNLDSPKSNDTKSDNDKSDNVKSEECVRNKVNLEDISREKMVEWTGYYLYYKPIHQLNDDKIAHSKRVLIAIENKIGVKFHNTASNKSMYLLQFGKDKIKWTYKPLIIYTGLSTMKQLCYWKLYYNGFQKHVTPKSRITYFYYQNPDRNIKKTVLFIHGLGFGIVPYLSYIMELKESADLIIPILPNISNMEFTSYFTTLTDDELFPAYDKWRSDIKFILNKHNVDSLDVIAHSFGTIILGILLKDDEIREKIDKRIFVDPVCFINDCHKIFRYIRDPSIGIKNTRINRIFNSLIYDDIYMQYVAHRYLYGPQFWILDYDTMNYRKNLIILSKKDQIVPTNKVYDTLKNQGVPCIIAEDAAHSEIFMTSAFKTILNVIKAYLFWLP